MTLRGRIAAVASLAVAVAVIAAAVSLYLALGADLRGQLDRSLEQRAQAFIPPPHPGAGGGAIPGNPHPGAGEGPPPANPERAASAAATPENAPGPGAPPPQHGPPGAALGAPPGGGEAETGLPSEVSPAPFGGASGYVQFLSPAGQVHVPGGQGTAPARIPPDAGDRQIAARGSGRSFSDRVVNGTRLRVLTVGIGGNGALMIARPLTEVDSDLDRILLILVIVTVCGIALAALLGRLVARTALAPIVRFTHRTEQLTDGLDASQRLEVRGRDELARLAASFNATLAALERSVEAQRQLIADASHELRTPMAALRANIQVLGEAGRLSAADQQSLRQDIVVELDELTALVADLVELARGGASGETGDERVDLEEVVGEAVARARRRSSVRLSAQLEPATVRGNPDRISRAVTNLLENARKWSPPDGLVEVDLRDGVLTVRDHGPGFAEADLPHVFERFYRAESARSLPGSGLGLAIVRQTAEAHGGYVRAMNAAGGGAAIEISFAPSHAPAPPPDGPAAPAPAPASPPRSTTQRAS